MTSSSCRRLLPVALLTLGLLSGCALAPGSHMDYESESISFNEKIEIMPITQSLVADYQPMPLPRATAMPAALRSELEDYEYQIGVGDVLDIIVYDHPELTIPAGAERSAAEAGNRVRNDGTIFYPYIGRVKVAGRTLDETRSLLTRQLSSYITDPQLDVRLAGFNSKKVYISGAVSQPGTLPITSVPLTIIDAISQAGGALVNANWHNVVLTRDGDEIPISLYALLRRGDLRENRLMRNGDILYVPTSENQAVAIMGQIRNPGSIQLGSERLSLTGALARAGGIIETTAEPSGIFVIRGEEVGAEKLATVYQLDVRNAVAFTLGNQFILQPQDVIYVTTAPIARWNRVISLLLPTVGLPGSVASTGSSLDGL